MQASTLMQSGLKPNVLAIASLFATIIQETVSFCDRQNVDLDSLEPYQKHLNDWQLTLLEMYRVTYKAEI